MNIEEFQAEMDRMDACWPARQDAAKAVARREVLWERLQEFSVRTLQAARNTLIDSGLEFMPSVPEIIDACREADEFSRPKEPTQRARHKDTPHNCSTEKPEHSNAWVELMMVLPYEAAHVLCPGKIPATCPICGSKHMELGVFDDIVKRHAESDTANWNTCFKGLMLCSKCEKKVR